MYIYIKHFNMECLSLMFITVENNYKLEYHAIKWKPFDHFDS